MRKGDPAKPTRDRQPQADAGSSEIEPESSARHRGRGASAARMAASRASMAADVSLVTDTLCWFVLQRRGGHRRLCFRLDVPRPVRVAALTRLLNPVPGREVVARRGRKRKCGVGEWCQKDLAAASPISMPPKADSRLSEAGYSGTRPRPANRAGLPSEASPRAPTRLPPRRTMIRPERADWVACLAPQALDVVRREIVDMLASGVPLPRRSARSVIYRPNSNGRKIA